jgi:hypothetical protein
MQLKFLYIEFYKENYKHWKYLSTAYTELYNKWK